MATQLGYLGRSESWVLAEVIPDDAALPPGADAYSHVDGERGGREWEQISLMAPEPPGHYKEWRDRAVARALEPLPLPDERKSVPKKLKDARQKAEAP